MHFPFSSFPGLTQAFIDSKVHSSKANLHQTLLITPYLWNPFHFFAINQNNHIFSSSFAYSVFKVRSMLDYHSLTPLHYLLSSSNLNYRLINFMFEYIIDYLEDESARSYGEIESIHRSLSSIFLKFIVTKANPKLKDRYLNLCYHAPSNSDSLPQFGNPTGRHIFARTPSVHSEIQDQIYTPGQERVYFNTTMLYYDYNVISDDMLDIALVLKSIKAEDVFRTPVIARIIDHLWEKTRSAIISTSLFFSILMILFSVYIGLGMRILPLEIVIICLASLILGGEVLQMYTLKDKYLSSVFNFADVVNSILMIAFIAARIADNDDSLALEWISSLTILLGYLRWISYLRYFKTTSKHLLSISSV